MLSYYGKVYTYCLFNLTGKNMNLKLFCSTTALSK